jgi:sterol desaturase/sphingolipid hydroxylase (fatty acid hydroxylase superfamily)
MNDALYGESDRRGGWRPFNRIIYPPVFVWPAQPLKFLHWLINYPGFILPWNLFYVVLSVVLWVYLTPSMETMKAFSIGWISYLLLRNAIIVFLFYGAFHLRLYIQRTQGSSFKFNAKWLAKNNRAFLTGDQTVDNVIRTLLSAVPIWTAYEVLTLWAFANGFIPFASFEQHPFYFVGLMFLIPLWREVHFYVVHRMLHWPWFYRTAHRVHHKNINPGPWSGLAMHPIEHLLYFSGILIHWIVPSHPVHALFNAMHAGLSPAPAHTGFDKIVVGKESLVDTESYAHYLHHKYFECNYADGVVPLDKWFGTFHDGSSKADERMSKRLMAMRARIIE